MLQNAGNNANTNTNTNRYCGTFLVALNPTTLCLLTPTAPLAISAEQRQSMASPAYPIYKEFPGAGIKG